MQSPGGWTEPGQRPDFDEYTIILKGRLKVETEDDILYINSGEAIITYAGEWVKYSTPDKNGAKYIAVCIPLFAPETVNRNSIDLNDNCMVNQIISNRLKSKKEFNKWKYIHQSMYSVKN